MNGTVHVDNYSLQGWVDSLKTKHSYWNMQAGILQDLTLFNDSLNMRAKTIINETQEFQRGGDPKDSMNLGNPDIRKINTSLKSIHDIVSAGYNLDELDFPNTIEAIDNLKGMILIVIANYLKRKFGWEFSKMGDNWGDHAPGEELSADIGKGYELRIQLSNTLKSYTLRLYTRDNYVTSVSASTNLNSMDKKAKDIIKKYLK